MCMRTIRQHSDILKRMNSTEPMLSITNLVKKYGTNTAVDSISFTVARGAFFGLLGPNGAGKSTTIGCITGTARVTSGTILVGGIDVVTDYKAARRKIGISAQEFNVDIFSKVDELLDFMGGYYGMPKSIRQPRVEELLTKFDLQAHRHKQFKELSGGLKRRAILARALMHDPELLILDEPTAGVDVEQRHELWKYLRDLNASGKTIILTSHYLEEVELLCDEIAIVNKGRIVAEGSKLDFIKDGKSLEARYLEITKGETY